MTLIATYGNQSFGCSPMELNRPGPSYTVETLTALHNQNPDAELFYITGVDAIADILAAVARVELSPEHDETMHLATV